MAASKKSIGDAMAREEVKIERLEPRSRRASPPRISEAGLSAQRSSLPSPRPLTPATAAPVTSAEKVAFHRAIGYARGVTPGREEPTDEFAGGDNAGAFEVFDAPE